MRKELELFEMYKEEKAIMIGDFRTRSGLEEFPSYKEWKLDYTSDFLELHQPVSQKEAKRVMEEAIASGNDEMVALLTREMKIDPKSKKQKKAKAIKKPTAKVASVSSVKKSTKGTGTVRKTNKAELSRKIFVEMYPGVLAGTSSRKEVIAKFVDVGLTAAGASTYYQKWKKETA